MSLSTLLVHLSVLSSLCWLGGATLLGGQTQIKDLNDKYVNEAASFAVQTINKDTSGAHLRVLVRVVEGTSQVATYIIAS